MFNTSHVFTEQNISAIEPDNSFENQKDIENLINANQDTSLQSADINDQIKTVQTAPEVTTGNMVMIDQAALQELLQAKQILDAQKAQEQAFSAERARNTSSAITQGFNSALFLTPPKTQMNNFSPSTDASSNVNLGGESVQPFSACNQIQSPYQFNSIFATPLYNHKISNYSEFHNLNDENQTNKFSKLDSKFNKEIVEEESYTEKSQLSSRAQNAIGVDLFNIIDCDSSYVDQKNNKETPIEQYNSSPETCESSNPSRSFNSSQGNNSPPNLSPSIFSQAPLSPSKLAVETLNAPSFNPNSAIFVPKQMTQNLDSAQATNNNKKEKEHLLFDFPEGGWECSKCQNYNFKGREICYRCKKEKTSDDFEGKPKHMSQAKLTKKQKKAIKAEKEATAKQNEHSKLDFANKWASNPNYMNPQEKSHNKCSQNARNGDWTCERCQNHNFAFRDVCNICFMPQAESLRMNFEKEQAIQQQWTIQQQQMVNPQVQQMVAQIQQMQTQMFYPTQ